MKIDLKSCKEITTQEYCDLSDKIDLRFEGSNRS